MQSLRIAFAFTLILALVPALSVMPQNVSGQGYVTITTQTTTTRLYTYATTTNYETTILTSTSTSYSDALTVPAPDPSLTTDPCGYVSLQFSALKGQHVSVSLRGFNLAYNGLTSPEAFSFLVMSNSVRKSWTWNGHPVLGGSANAVTPCHNVPEGTLISRDRITSYTNSFDFPTSDTYWFWFLNWIYAPIVVNFDMVGSPTVITSTVSSISYATTPTTELLALTTAVTQVGLPLSNLGMVGAVVAVAVIAGVLVFARRRKTIAVATLVQEQPTAVQKLPREAVASQSVAHTTTVQSLPVTTRVAGPLTPENPIVKPTPESRPARSEPSATMVVETPMLVPKQIPSSQLILSTGYKDLDKALEGGIPQGFAVVIASPSYDERDLLLRKIIESVIANGGSAFYISNDISKTQDLFSRFQSGFFAFSSYAGQIFPQGPNLYKIPGIENLSDANISLGIAIRDAKGKAKDSRKLLLIDILSDVLLKHKATMTRRWLSDFVSKRKAEGFTVIAALNPLVASKEETESVVDFFDGVIEIHERTLTERARRFLLVKKMYGRRYSENELMLDRDKLL